MVLTSSTKKRSNTLHHNSDNEMKHQNHNVSEHHDAEDHATEHTSGHGHVSGHTLEHKSHHGQKHASHNKSMKNTMHKKMNHTMKKTHSISNNSTSTKHEYCLQCKCKVDIMNVKLVEFKGKGNSKRYRLTGTCEKGHKWNRFTKAPST